MTYEELLQLFTPQQLAAQGFNPQGQALPPTPPEPEQWYTDYSAGRTGRPFTAPPTMAVLHDFASKSDPKNIDKYNWAFDEQGIYKLLPEGVKGAHARDFNTQLGIAHRGYEGEKLTPGAIRNAEKLLSKLEAQYPGLEYKTHYALGPRGTLSGGKSPKEGTWFQQVRPGGKKMTPEEFQMLLLSEGAVDPTAGVAATTRGIGAQQPSVAVPAAAVDTSGGGTPQPGPPARDPRQNPQQAAEGRSKWETVLADDRTRAWLAAFGARVMQPSWGGPMGQLGSGLEAGALAYGNTGKAMEDLRLKELDREDKDLDRESRERIASANIEGRQQVAEMRGQFSLQRAAQAAGVKNTAENKIFADNYTKTAAAYRTANANAAFTGTPVLSEEEIAMRASQAAQDALAQHRAAFGKGAGTGTAGARNSEIPAGAGGQGGDKGQGQGQSGAKNEPGSLVTPPAQTGIGSVISKIAPVGVTDLVKGAGAVGNVLRGIGTGGTVAAPSGGGQPAAAPAQKQSMSWDDYVAKLESQGMAHLLHDPKERALMKQAAKGMVGGEQIIRMLDGLDAVYGVNPQQATPMMGAP